MEEKFVRVAPVMELVVRGQVITTTAEHPFYVAGEERFVPAGELKLEDQLVDSQGGNIAIDAIRVTDRLITVYNLRVVDFHTYFVGGKLWKFDAWVHNARYAPKRAGALADLGEGPEARAIRIRSDFEVGATRGSVIEEHHVFPQEMQRMFAKRGIDVHDFVIDLEVPIHRAIHGGGDWRLARQIWSGEWNAQMLRELKQTTRAAGRRLTADEIISVGENLMSRYGLSGNFHRYSRAPKK